MPTRSVSDGRLPTDTCLQLVGLARESIHYGLTYSCAMSVELSNYADKLCEPVGSFVTLTSAGRLRGCIGTLEAHRPLVEDVAANAYAAAFQDIRFKPLSCDEYPEIRVEISLLSCKTSITFKTEKDLIGQLRPGVDGVIIQSGERRATFLPTVWKSLPDPAGFLQQLKLKAGLKDHDNDKPLFAWRYRTQSFSD